MSTISILSAWPFHPLATRCSFTISLHPSTRPYHHYLITISLDRANDPQQLPSSSLLATSLYPLLTLGIAGSAVSGELGAAAWNAFQQSQMAQAQAQNDLGQSSSSHMGLGGQHSHSSFLSQSSGMLNPQQPMSTLSSSLDSPTGLARMESSSSLGRMDSGLPSMESMRTSSPRFSAASSPSGLGASSSFGSPRFESGHFDTRFDAGSSAGAGPSTLRSSTNSSSRFDTNSSSQFDANTTSQFDASSQFDSNYDSPQYGTATSTSPPGFGSSSSTPPGFGGIGSGRRSSSSSDRNRDEVK